MFATITTLLFVLGTTIPELVPPGPGAGEWNSERASFENRLVAPAAHSYLAGDDAQRRWGKDAARSFHHYFDNDGEDLLIDLERFLADIPSAQKFYLEQIEAFKTFAQTLPDGSHHFTSAEVEYLRIPREESENWYLAIDGYQVWADGNVQVHTDDQGTKIFQAEWTYHLWDRYDWDPGVKIPIETPLGRVVIDQDKVGEFHRQGLAQEFTTVGSHTIQLRWQR